MVAIKKLLQLAKLFLGWPLAAVAIFFILKYLLDNSDVVLGHISQINLPIFGLSIICFLVYYFMRAFAWGLMMKMMGHNIKFQETAYAWQFSEVKRYVPGNIWSFLSRAALFENLGVPKKKSGKAILFEIEFLIASNMLLSLFSIGIISDYLKDQGSVSLIWFISAILLSLLLIFGYRLNKKPLGFLPNFGIAQNTLVYFVYLATFLFLSLAMYLTTASILGMYNFISLIGFFPFSFLIGYLSLITPSGLGVREAVITFGLSSLLTTPIAGVIAIFTRIALVFSELLFTGLVLILNKPKLWKS